MNAEEQLIDDRDYAEAMLDKFAYAIAPVGVIGEHSSANDPWANALEMLTSAAEVRQLTADRDRAREIAVALEQEVAQLQAKLDQPCGSCHPCTNYRDETWRAADRKPPHVHEWDELRAAEKRVREVCSEPTPHPSHDHLCPDDILRALDGGEAL